MSSMTVRELRDLLSGEHDDDLVAVTCCLSFDKNTAHVIKEYKMTRYTHDEKHSNFLYPTIILRADENYVAWDE